MYESKNLIEKSQHLWQDERQFDGIYSYFNLFPKVWKALSCYFLQINRQKQVK